MPFHIESEHFDGAVKVIVPQVFPDHRGWFIEAYRRDSFTALGIPDEFVQHNQSCSVRGVIRGLHFQYDPPMAKLMRVVTGRVFAVAVDIRKGSPTLGQWFGCELSAENKRQVYAPAGFARGFCVLSDEAELHYLCSATYNPATEVSVRWDDPEIGIEWPVDKPILSDKDARAQSLADWLASDAARYLAYEAEQGDMTLRGCATPEATAAYAARFEGEAVPGHFRLTVDGLTVSSIGLGTYLGEPSDEVDERYQQAIERALALGCNHFDTAVNYRFQRSERLLGRALRDAIKRGDVQRDEVIVATKGGFVPFDGGLPPDPRRWVYEHYIEPGLAHANEFAATYQHCLAPDFLDAMIDQSCENLGVETIDIYYLHNPETQRISNTHETFRRRMLDAFECLEAAVANGAIMAYGTATWTAYRSPPATPDYVSLTEMMDLAYQVAGDENHFRYVQMPYNLVMTEAFALQNQQVGQEFFSPIEAAQQLGLTVMVSATLKQGLLATPFMADLSPYFPGAQTDAQKAVQFVRSTPGVASALVGMSRVEHVEEILALHRLRPIDGDTIRGMFEP